MSATLALVTEANVSHRDELITTARSLRNEARRLHALADTLTHTAARLETDVRSDLAMIGGRDIITRLQEIVEIGEEVHYRDLIPRLAEHGYFIGGASPEGPLLAAIYRSSEFEAIPPARSGRYRRVS